MRTSDIRTLFSAWATRANVIKSYFLDYEESVSNDFVFSQGGRKLEFMQRDIDDWRITFVDTGLRSTIGDRLRLVEPYLNGDDCSSPITAMV